MIQRLEKGYADYMRGDSSYLIHYVTSKIKELGESRALTHPPGKFTELFKDSSAERVKEEWQQYLKRQRDLIKVQVGALEKVAFSSAGNPAVADRTFRL